MAVGAGPVGAGPVASAPANDLTRASREDASDASTRLAGDSCGPAESSSRASGSGSSGWLTSSGSIDHGRFPPGTVLDQRYRITGLLGRGGMGEVYRADDLRLGQPVALKCLPESLGRDPVRLAQLHNEVRTARQVSHPNICRVHDIGEVDGLLYLSMEYVDGEDLATSLRRIGRLPEDKTLEIARQLCAGVAAAHERGVLHRDLKPANVMLDGQGKVRIMDFGLAAMGDVADVRAGTPAYMAPEQLHGKEVTTKSDIFALGLVLYEIFTGRRVFQAKTLAELVEQHHAAITPPTAVVATLDPAIERVILRCLDADPAQRPGSALVVSAALPGGDPLAAALLAGETPSPDMVAAAGGAAATIGPAAGMALLAGVVILVGIIVTLGSRHQMTARAGLELEPRVLADRARTFEREVGVGADAADRAFGLFVDGELQEWIRARPDATAPVGAVPSAVVSPLGFWYRSSPRALVPAESIRLQPGPDDPALLVPGMTLVVLDATGRLLEFSAVPGRVEAVSPAGDSRGPAAPAPGEAVDWAVFFKAAGLDRSQFTPATPEVTPPVFADARAAWTGRSARFFDVPLRIEAAAHRGMAVSFVIVGPWLRSTPTSTAPAGRADRIVNFVTSVVVVPSCLVGALLLVRRNLRLGRGDRRGARTLAVAVFWLELVRQMLGATHHADALVEQARVFAMLGRALFTAAIVGTLYLALEPSVRRAWPHLLITWSRVTTGRLRDAMVGRDLLVGACAGALMTAITFAHQLLPAAFGWPEFQPAAVSLPALDGPRMMIVVTIEALAQALFLALLGGTGLVLVRLVVSKPWLAFAILVVAFSSTAAEGQFVTGRLWLDLLLGGLSTAIVLAMIVRFGFVAGAAAFFVHLLSKATPMAIDPGRFYFPASVSVGMLVVGLAVAGFVLARAGEPPFGAKPGRALV